MKQTLLRALPFVAASALPLAPACAQADAAACQRVIAAMARLAQTPNHQFTSHSMPGMAPKQSEIVMTGNTMWLLVGGRWRSIPYDAQKKIAEMQRKAALSSAAGKVSCSRLRDDAVAGEAATIYSMHDVTDAGVVDSQLWISTARELPLRQVIDIPEVKSHLESRIDYSNVKPPARQ